MKIRSNEPEIMDDLHSKGPVLEKTLHELDFINRWLGGNNVTLTGLQTLLQRHPQKQTWQMVDLGTGSGYMLVLIARFLRAKNKKVQLVGIDANPAIVDFATRTHSDPEISFKPLNLFDPEFRQLKPDLFTATLFLHHFTHAELVSILKQLHSQSKIGIVINDLHRHWLAYESIRLLTRLFSKSTMVKYDGPLSVRRGFLRSDWVQILTEAGISTYSLHWKWAFRWQLVIWK